MEHTPKYKIGDRVRIHPNLSRQYKNVVTEMLKYAGKYVTIAYLPEFPKEHSCYKIHEDKRYWSWGDNMIEHVETTYEIY